MEEGYETYLYSHGGVHPSFDVQKLKKIKTGRHGKTKNVKANPCTLQNECDEFQVLGLGLTYSIPVDP